MADDVACSSSLLEFAMASTTATLDKTLDTMMKERSQSVGTLLEPWVEEVAKHGHARINYTTPRMGPQLATIEFVFTALTEGYVSRHDVIALREALDVLHVAAGQNVKAVEEALSGLCYHDIELVLEDELVESEPATTLTSSTIDIEFVLTFYGAQGRFLEEVVAPAFFTERSDRSDMFKSTLAELMEEQHGQLTPINCRMNIVSMDASFLDEVEQDYLERIVSFIRIVDSHGSDPTDALAITSINLELNELAITPTSSRAMNQLQHVKIPVCCTRIGIDPRTMTCSSEELTAFLDGIGSAKSPMTVTIGHVNLSEPVRSLDANGKSREKLIQTIFNGIAGSSAVSGISFGPLLSLMSSTANRHTVWTELFRSVYSSKAKADIRSLSLTPQIQLTHEDAEAIRSVVTTFNAAESKPLAVKSITMWLTDSAPNAVESLIEALGKQVTELSMYSEAHALIPSRTVETVVGSCPHLASLSLVSAEVDSMEIFRQTLAPLTSLSLTSVTVNDTASMGSFLSELATPTTRLAKNMLKLHIKTDNNTEAPDLLSGSEADVVLTMMQNNKVLRDLELSVGGGTPPDVIVKIQKHNHEVLADPLLLAQKLAFLHGLQVVDSVTDQQFRSRLDQDVVQLIFGFAAERVFRHVFIDW